MSDAGSLGGEGIVKKLSTCGVHASDPSVMHQTVSLAQQYGVKIGAHPSLPDRQGFGRREMKTLGRGSPIRGAV